MRIKHWLSLDIGPDEDVILENLPEERYYGSSPKHCASGQKPHRSNIKNRRGETCVGAGT